MDRLGIEIAAVSFSYTAGNEEAPTVFQGRASLGGAATPWPQDEASIGASSRRRVFLGFGISLVLPALPKRGGCSLTTARPKR